MYIYIFLHKYDSFFRSSPSWVFLLKVSGEFAEWFPCWSVISTELLCWDHILAWVFCEFALYSQGTSLWKNLNLSFAKALLSLIIRFKGTFTYFYHFFVHDSQIFNILQLFLIIFISSYICVSCVHNLSCFSFFSIIDYDPNKFCFHHLK